MTALNDTFLGLGDDAGLAAVKSSAEFYRMLLSEATVTAYQDIFMLSGFISLFNIVPAVLQRCRAVVQESVPAETTPADRASTPAR